jgi:hypothetical protein
VLKVFFLFSLLFFAGCDSEKNTSPIAPLNIDQQLVVQTEQQLLNFEQVFSLGQVFRDQPEADQNLLRSALNKARAGLQILRRFPNNLFPRAQADLAYNELSAALYLFERIRLLEGDEEETELILNNVRLVRMDLGVSLGYDVSSWVIYKHNFGEGIEPEFRAPEGEDRHGAVQWVTNFQIDLPKAKVQAREGFAWMVSRSFDLSQVRNPQFRFHASHLVTSPDALLTLFEVVDRVFNVYVILDLEPGESLEEIRKNQPERMIEVEYSVDEVPLAQNFHDRWLPFRSLAPYQDHRISIGFLFDTRSIEFTQFYGWDIFDFEITGAGLIFSDFYYYEPHFAGSLADFNSESQEFLGEKFQASDSGGAIVESTGEAEAVLLSPMFFTRKRPFQDHQLNLILEDEARVGESSLTEVLISTQYRPGQGFDRHTQGWQVLASLNDSREPTLQTIDLNDYVNQEFYLAFYFQSTQANESWHIQTLRLEGQGIQIFNFPFLMPEPQVSIALHTRLDFRNRTAQDLLQTEYENENAPFWRPSRDNDGMRANGFRRLDDGTVMNRTGISRLIHPNVKLEAGKNVLRLIHRTRFYRVPHPHFNAYVRPSGSEEDWTLLNFENNDLFVGTGDVFQTSSWALLPFEDQEVDISFTYQATESEAPEWIIQGLEVGVGEL